ncbi:single-stranded DNA-binding protein [Paractinoplanes globisporus]|uniref:Single-stranded DNA-binding protein n=1 Tax=Paractinoplanes globisporus TaxID=113565 RepID=A0ABW6WFQ4_9ACTN|nr:single-stranded DNA-binding protein [Actinoplanes globisporus]
MHQHTLSGRLGDQPQLRHTPNTGTSVCTLRLAHDRWSKGPDDEWIQGETLWLDVTAWGELAERCCQFAKGTKVIVNLRDDLRTRTFRRGDDTVGVRLEATASTVEAVQPRPRADEDARADSYAQYDLQAA